MTTRKAMIKALIDAGLTRDELRGINGKQLRELYNAMHNH